MIPRNLITIILLMSLTALAPAQPNATSQPVTGNLAKNCSVILGRPTATSVTVSILYSHSVRADVLYGLQQDHLTCHTGLLDFHARQPQSIVLTKLKPNTRYFYQVQSAPMENPCIGTFHTQRRPGRPFVFTVQADSHLDANTSPELYRQTLANALADTPDFHIDLGDTFMTDKHPSRDSAARQYLAQRDYLGNVGRSAPIFLVPGNHDGESGKLRRGGEDSLAVWSNTMRKRYFPNPVPDGFYTGNATKDPFAGLLQDYYAWEWGDALFIALDPYWYSDHRGSKDNWGLTLGREQYDWLKKTLETSHARFKFVFIHQLVGGLDRQGRGGVEAVPFYEWGGRNADGSNGFDDHRPGWGLPIHPLLIRNHVTAVFHGHDHFFSHQERDGIAYILVPQPGHLSPRDKDMAGDYGYRSGTSLPSPGHLRVKVSSQNITVTYIRINRQIGYTCVLPSAKNQF